ncbi:MAG: hypothetical protein U1F98_17415 [Verrucomicrobiota bacterium]
MKATIAKKLATGTQDRSSQNQDLPDFAAAPATTTTGTIVDLPHPVVTPAPALSDQLARFEGIARWGLNE